MAWTCSTCTFDNATDDLSKCAMCATRREQGKPTNKSSNDKRASSIQQPLFAGSVSSEVIDLTASVTAGAGSQAEPAWALSTASVSRKRKVPTGHSVPVSSFFADSGTQASSQCFSTTTSPASRNFSPDEIRNVLAHVFGLQKLRSLQPQVVQTALQQKSQLLVLATGGGKSLCYQLPACLLGGLTIVISPLIALMQDQVQALIAKGIPAALVSSNQTASQNQAVLERVLLPTSNTPSNNNNNDDDSSSIIQQSKKKRPTVKSTNDTTMLTLLYITPESIQTERMRTLLKKLHKSNRLTMFAVDEAHCLSSWGHDFRPAYRKLTWLRTTFPKVPCMACTATATPQVVTDIQTILNLSQSPLYKGSFDRPNIYYKVRYKDSLDATGGGALNDMVKWIIQQHTKYQVRKEKCSGIVYVHKREDTAMISNLINIQATKWQASSKTLPANQPPIMAEPYHAGLKKADRNRILEEWSCDKVQVAVATVAFGMGIDLAHVRYVVHWTLPKTVEGFYQESGRAGRDGLPSHSLLYYSQDDVRKFQYLIRLQHEQSQKKNSSTTTTSTANAEASLERKLSGLQVMSQYCAKPRCRRNALIQHFGGSKVDCKETCDFCKDPIKVERLMQSAAVVKDVLGGDAGSCGRRGKSKGNNKEPWNGQWKGPHDGGDEIARDYGMVGGLRVTDAAPSRFDYGAGGGDDIMARSKSKVACGGGGFRKASSILDRYEALECRENKSDGGNSDFVHFGDKQQQEEEHQLSTSVKIPDHFRVKINASSKPCKPKPKELTSQDHARKAEQLRHDLGKLNSEQEARMKTLLAKRKASFSSKV